MDKYQLQVNYIPEDGFPHTAGSMDCSHFVIKAQETEEILTLTLEPREPVKITGFALRMRYGYEKDSRIFVNGYQSWTDSREYFANSRMSHLNPLSKKHIMNHPMRAAGDYDFKEYPSKKGMFHGYSYGYVRNGDEVDLFASLTEERGFTIFNFDTNNNIVLVEKELEGVAVDAPYEAMKIVHLHGSYDEVFDRWFALMEIPAPRVKFKCGYTTWYNYYPNINEQIVRDDLEALAKLPEKIDIFQIDDGYQTAVGDWLSIDVEKFPGGMKAVADNIHEKGMLAGLWLAPFGAEYKSKIATEHKDWLIHDKNGKLVECGGNWGGFYALDIHNPQAADYIRHCFDVVLNEWGYDMVKLDFLYAACIVPGYNKSRGQLMCEAMDFIRDCVGDKLILGCGVPLAPAFGKVDFCRIGADMGLNWAETFYSWTTHREDVSTKNAVNNAIFRRGLDGRAFCNDPDVFLLRDYNIQQNFNQRRLLTKINQIFGNLLFISDNVDKYNEEQMEVFRSTIRPIEKKVLSAGYVDKRVIAVDYMEDGVKKHLKFNVVNGKLLEGSLS